MHYIGMTALHASAHLTHDPLFVVASVVIAIATSGLALRLAAESGGHPPLLLSAAALGIAIAGMHYTAMAGLTIFPHESPASSAPALSPDLLAIIVAIVAFIVSGLFLLVLVPDRSSRQASAPPEARLSGLADAALPVGEAVPAALQPIAEPTAVANGDLRPSQFLPVEREGATHHLSVEKIVAVRANAHYTYVFDGTSTYFCPLAISEVEARLGGGRFARVHRSHIINIDRVVRLKRAGDNGLIELKGDDAYAVPVSRSRLAWVKSQLGLRTQQLAS